MRYALRPLPSPLRRWRCDREFLAEFRKVDDPVAAKVELGAPFYDVAFDFVLSHKKAG